ncbi:MAG: caspase family protein [Flammeovirgaceae bacterium]|nr:caspase family protein [Flammeovirgaceae bacterium]
MMSKYIVVFLVASFLNTLQAQTPYDLTGDWRGTIQVPGGAVTAFYTLKQNGLKIEGFVQTKSMDGSDSLKARLNGFISKNKIQIRSVEFLYRVGNGCLAVTDFVYTNLNNQESLIGKWRGDLRLTTCPPGISGKVTVSKVTPQIVSLSPTRDAATEVTIQQSDFEGSELYKELSNRKYYALIIGINDYQDKSIVQLDNPVKDATALGQILSTYYTFESDNIIVLTDPTRTKIIESFDELSLKINERDQLLIFYAGHGIWDERLNQGFWLPSDASLNSKAQWLSNSTIRDYVGGIRAKHTLLITDACFSGSIFKERAVFTNSKAMLEMYKLPSRKAMTSGALKTVPDKSVFIEYLTKNLIQNQSPLLSAEELFRTFKVAVINNSPNGQVPQYGPIGQVGDEGGDFIFLKRN